MMVITFLLCCNFVSTTVLFLYLMILLLYCDRNKLDASEEEHEDDYFSSKEAEVSMPLMESVSKYVDIIV